MEESTNPPKEEEQTPRKDQDPKGAPQPQSEDVSRSSSSEQHKALATPAVRGLLKELQIEIHEVRGTGRDGRVLKEDVLAFAESRKSQSISTDPPSLSATPTHAPAVRQRQNMSSPTGNSPMEEKTIDLTPIQIQMYKTMTKSLQIPHFLYADEIDVTALSKLRRSLNRASNNQKSHLPLDGQQQQSSTSPVKYSYLPFIIKAVSLALEDYPLLNARLEQASSHPLPQNSSTSSSSSSSSSSSASPHPSQQPPPRLTLRPNHNIGIAMDTPQGLLVPNIKSVQSLSIQEIALQITHLQHLARSGKLTPHDLRGGTITVSNIGSLGGTYVSPIIVEGEVAILGVGKVKKVPAFSQGQDDDDDDDGMGMQVVEKDIMNFSWSADHRIVDGATMARMAELVKGFVESPGRMIARLR